MKFSVFIPTLFLTACALAPHAEISGDLAWQPLRLEGKEIPAAQDGREAAYLRLTKDKSVEGSGGCNRIAGKYHQTGEQIEFNLISTRRACFSGMAEEDAFLKALARTRFWKRQGDILRLYDANKTLLLEMGKKDG